MEYLLNMRILIPVLLVLSTIAVLNATPVTQTTQTPEVKKIVNKQVRDEILKRGKNLKLYSCKFNNDTAEGKRKYKCKPIQAVADLKKSLAGKKLSEKHTNHEILKFAGIDKFAPWVLDVLKTPPREANFINLPSEGTTLPPNPDDLLIDHYAPYDGSDFDNFNYEYEYYDDIDTKGDVIQQATSDVKKVFDFKNKLETKAHTILKKSKIVKRESGEEIASPADYGDYYEDSEPQRQPVAKEAPAPAPSKQQTDEEKWAELRKKYPNFYAGEAVVGSDDSNDDDSNAPESDGQQAPEGGEDEGYDYYNQSEDYYDDDYDYKEQDYGYNYDASAKDEKQQKGYENYERIRNNRKNQFLSAQQYQSGKQQSSQQFHSSSSQSQSQSSQSQSSQSQSGQASQRFGNTNPISSQQPRQPSANPQFQAGKATSQQSQFPKPKSLQQSTAQQPKQNAQEDKDPYDEDYGFYDSEVDSQYGQQYAADNYYQAYGSATSAPVGFGAKQLPTQSPYGQKAANVDPYSYDTYQSDAYQHPDPYQDFQSYQPVTSATPASSYTQKPPSDTAALLNALFSETGSSGAGVPASYPAEPKQLPQNPYVGEAANAFPPNVGPYSPGSFVSVPADPYAPQVAGPSYQDPYSGEYYAGEYGGEYAGGYTDYENEVDPEYNLLAQQLAGLTQQIKDMTSQQTFQQQKQMLELQKQQHEITQQRILLAKQKQELEKQRLAIEHEKVLTEQKKQQALLEEQKRQQALLEEQKRQQALLDEQKRQALLQQQELERQRVYQLQQQQQQQYAIGQYPPTVTASPLQTAALPVVNAQAAAIQGYHPAPQGPQAHRMMGARQLGDGQYTGNQAGGPGIGINAQAPGGQGLGGQGLGGQGLGGQGFGGQGLGGQGLGGQGLGGQGVAVGPAGRPLRRRFGGGRGPGGRPGGPLRRGGPRGRFPGRRRRPGARGGRRPGGQVEYDGGEGSYVGDEDMYGGDEDEDDDIPVYSNGQLVSGKGGELGEESDDGGGDNEGYGDDVKVKYKYVTVGQDGKEVDYDSNSYYDDEGPMIDDEEVIAYNDVIGEDGEVFQELGPVRQSPGYRPGPGPRRRPMMGTGRRRRPPMRSPGFRGPSF